MISTKRYFEIDKQNHLQQQLPKLIFSANHLSQYAFTSSKNQNMACPVLFCIFSKVQFC
jgi:hypothetical protein